MNRLKEIIRFTVRPALFLIVLIVLFGILVHPGSPISLNLEILRSHVDALGFWGPLYYIFSVIILELFAVPLVPLIICAGILFGKMGGIVTALVATTSSALFSWFIARFLIHDAWREMIFHRLGVFTPFLLQKGIFHVAISRSLPIPFGIVSYATGLIYSDTKTIVLGNFIGITPWCIIYTLLSASLLEKNWFFIILILVIILIIESLFFIYWYNKNKTSIL